MPPTNTAKYPAGSSGRPIIGVVHYGLGPIGRSVAALAATRSWLRPVAAVDVSDELQGMSLADVVGSASGPTPTVAGALGAIDGAAVALHCTSSSLEKVAGQLVELVGCGLNVISTTEELSYPWRANALAAGRVDQAARAHGVTVLGTGVNPGFAMEYLPVVLSGVSQQVSSVVVRRVQDAGSRRLPLQRKIGAGLSVDEFRARVDDGTLGHVGLRESVEALAAVFGWELSELTETIDPVIAPAATTMLEGAIAAGRVAGIHQRCQGSLEGEVRVELTLDIAVGIGPSSDHIEVLGVPDLTLDIPGGLHGDTATAAMVVNAIPRVLHAEAGLKVMSELPPPNPGAPMSERQLRGG